MAKQTTINVPKYEPKLPTLHEAIVDVIKRYGPRKQAVLAEQLGASEQHFSDVFGGKTGKHWPEAWIEFIVKHYDFEAQVPALVAGWRGLTARPPRKRTAAEELRRLKYALAKHNGLGKAIRDEAEALPDDVFADEEVAT